MYRCTEIHFPTINLNGITYFDVFSIPTTGTITLIIYRPPLLENNFGGSLSKSIDDLGRILVLCKFTARDYSAAKIITKQK